MDLKNVRDTFVLYYNDLQDQDGEYGAYRMGQKQRTDLYSSLDIAISRTIIGEDLQASLGDQEREAWIRHIHSFVTRDGSFTDTFNHSKEHANGMVISALGALGGKQPRPVALYDAFNTEEKIAPWLESIDWKHQWGASHLFWGGMLCFSFSKACTQDWLKRVFGWLDANLDERTGWWRKGMEHADRHQPLGGSVHILPIYHHHNHPFPYPERLIDSVLAMQCPNGRWHESNAKHGMTYMELDALYVLAYSRTLVPSYRKEAIQKAIHRYTDYVLPYWEHDGKDIFTEHPHWVLALIGTFGLLNQLDPDTYHDEVQWTDIFSDTRFYQTAHVEVLNA